MTEGAGIPPRPFALVYMILSRSSLSCGCKQFFDAKDKDRPFVRRCFTPAFLLERALRLQGTALCHSLRRF